MNIYCEWNKNRLEIKSGKALVGYVEEVCGDPVLFLTLPGESASLTFGEIEHVMDNFYNMPKK